MKTNFQQKLDTALERMRDTNFEGYDTVEEVIEALQKEVGCNITIGKIEK